MRWLTIWTSVYRHQKKECWHYWFAWHPVTVEIKPDGARIKVWLVWLLRKGIWRGGYDDAGWEYTYKEVT